MAYDSIERSAADGRPTELYRFTRRAVLAWNYTSADRDLTFDGLVYAAQPIQRGNIEQGPEALRSGLRLTVRRDFPVAALFMVAPPSDPINLVLRQIHYGDNEAITIWQGVITGVGFSAGQADIELEPLSGAMRRAGLRRNYQRTCPYALYSVECGADPQALRLDGTANAIAALTISVAAAAARENGYFAGGFLEWRVVPGEDVWERRFITAHVGGDVTIDMPPVGLAIGAQVRLYPGCDHSLSACAAKFGNALNYGGMPFIPTKNPFGSDPIY